MNRRQKVLAPILAPSQRITQMPCDRRDRDLFGVNNVLDPEATAHVGRDHMDLPLLEVEVERQGVAHLMRHLGGVVEDQFIQPLVPEGQGCPAFHGHASLPVERSEEHTSELQSLMRISYAVFCLKKKN